MADLGIEISKYTQGDHYPFHMPGHKGRFDPGFKAYDVDITEVEPFDDLHHPHGILKDLQAECAGFFGAAESFYLVNGSTCGILSAITAVMDTGDFYLLLDRGSHKSAYNAVLLKDIRPEFVFSKESRYGFYEGIYPQDVDTLLKKRQQKVGKSEKKTLKPCLYVTSPTYDGITSDIGKLAELLHAQDGFLIVDEAHGAHFGMHDIFPESAVRQGADIVIQSLHKTLPSPTQTAVMHICSPAAQNLNIREYLSIFETSSPSYILMSGISSCLKYLAGEGKNAFDEFAKRLESFYAETRDLKNLHVYYEEYDGKKRDISKILIGTGSTGLTGYELYEILDEKYHLKLEMAASFYVTALSSVMDSEEGFERLSLALHEIDESFNLDSMNEVSVGLTVGDAVIGQGDSSDNNLVRQQDEKLVDNFLHKFGRRLNPYPAPVTVSLMGSAFRSPKESVSLESALNRVSGGFVFLYPPGIPVLAPGELVTEEILKLIEQYIDMGFDIRGLTIKDNIHYIEVVK